MALRKRLASGWMRRWTTVRTILRKQSIAARTVVLRPSRRSEIHARFHFGVNTEKVRSWLATQSTTVSLDTLFLIEHSSQMHQFATPAFSPGVPRHGPRLCRVRLASPRTPYNASMRKVNATAFKAALPKILGFARLLMLAPLGRVPYRDPCWGRPVTQRRHPSFVSTSPLARMKLVRPAATNGAFCRCLVANCLPGSDVDPN